MWAQCTQAEFQLLLGCQNLMINYRKLLCSLSEPGFLESKTPLISGAKPPKIFSNQILSPKCLGVVMRSLVKMRKIMWLILSYLLNWQKCLHHLLQCSVRRTQDYLNINAYKSFGWENSQEALTIFFFQFGLSLIKWKIETVRNLHKTFFFIKLGKMLFPRGQLGIYSWHISIHSSSLERK